MRAQLSFSVALLVTLGAARTAKAATYFDEAPMAFDNQHCSPGELGCWTNYLQLVDVDGDGDLDVLMPNADGYFSKGKPQPLVVLLNDGKGHFTDAGAQVVNGFTGYLRQIAIGDVDGDGDLDLYLPSAWGAPDVFLINDGKGHFTDEAATRLPNVSSHAGATRFGDVDNDGDLDLLVSDGWAMSSPFVAHLYLNDGKGNFTDASTNLPTTKAGDGTIDFDLFDADGDFDLDLLVDMHQGTASLWLNDGTGKFTDVVSWIPKQSGLKYNPVACDIDGDGDLDLWFDNAGPGYTEQLLINDGQGHFTDETAMRVTGNVNGADDNGLACVDVDGDGDFDVIVASLSTPERVLINDGTGHFTYALGGFTDITDSTLWFDFGDVDGDGKIDCATGEGESSFLDRLYLGSGVSVDTRAPTFREVEAVKSPVHDGDVVAVRFAVVDESTTDTGPRLSKAFLRVDNGAMIDVPAVFQGGDMFRAVLPLGTAKTVKYSACAADRRNNQACSPPQQVDVLPAMTTSSGTSSSTVASASATSSATSTSGAGGASSSSATGGATSSSGGCSCEVERGGHGDGAGALLVACLLSALHRRSRRTILK